MGNSIIGASSAKFVNAGLTHSNDEVIWQVVDDGGSLFGQYKDAGAPGSVASEIWEMCKRFGHKIYQFFWTNNTLKYARKVKAKLSKMAGVSDVRLLESSSEGIVMTRNVNRQLAEFLDKHSSVPVSREKLKELKKKRTLWPRIFDDRRDSLRGIAKATDDKDLSTKIEILEKKLDEYQKDVSKKYAHKADDSCFLVRFRRLDGKGNVMASGRYSVIEDDVLLNEKKLQYHSFVQILEKRNP